MMKQLIFLLGLIFLFPNPVFADNSISQISVTPSVVHLDLSVDKPEAEIFYKNMSSQTVVLSFQAQDFKALEDSYSFSYLEGKDASNYHYSLSSWIHFSSTSLVLNPNETDKITVFVEKDKLSPGGHYASILAKIDSDNPNPKQIAIRGVLGSLLFVRTNTGKEIESASLPSFERVEGPLEFPKTFSFRFNNSGDTDLTPFGLLQIYGSGHHEVTRGIVNVDSAPTLPESIRRYYVPVRDTGFLLPGMYTATISLHFGKTNQTITKTVSFFSQGSIPLVPLSVTIGILLIWGILWRQKYLKERKT